MRTTADARPQPLPPPRDMPPAARQAGATAAPFLPRVLFGVRLAASVCLALFVTYGLELENPFWAATTAAIVCQPSLGASMQKGRHRALGTLVGGLAMVALLSLFPQQRDLLILGLALWCGACGFAVVTLRGFASYAAALAGITSAIIFADTLADPSSAFLLAVVRVGEIAIGIFAAAVVALLTDTGSAGRQLEGLLRHAAARLSQGFLATLVAGTDTPETRAARHDMVRALGPLDAAIAAATGESAFLRARTGNLQAAAAALLDALVAWRDIGSHLGSHPGRAGADCAGLRHALTTVLARIDPADIDRAPERLAQDCRLAIAEIRAIGCGDATRRMLADAALTVATGIEAMAAGILLLRTRRGARRRWRAPPVVADPLPAVLNGARAFAAVAATAAFWVATAWPAGPFAIVFAAATTLIFGAFGDEARARAGDYAAGAAAMAALGAVLYVCVLPSLTTFPALAGVLAALFVPLGIMQAGTWHPVAFLAMSIASLPLLGVGNPASYDAAGYLNLALAVIAGTVTGTLFFVAMPVMDPPARARRLLALSLRDVHRLARGPLPTSPARWTALMSRRLEALPAQAPADDAAALMALLALGRAIMDLAQGLRGTRERARLSLALAHLAAGRPAAAQAVFAALEEACTGAPEEARLRARITVIREAIDAHAGLFTGRAGVPPPFI
ncbi:FUSC family protein [Xanthobacter sediminis]|uniref:FUSC family protein n=1 Tax=Xanthobacter sediminis TaxID=3119926 RepID=UPI00372C7CE1